MWIRLQAITITNDDLLSFGPLGAQFSYILIQSITFFYHANAFENVPNRGSLSWRDC